MKKIWILSKITKKKYGDSTRPYFLGKYLSKNFEVTQYCRLNAKEESISYINFFDNLSLFNFPKILKKAFFLHKNIKKNVDIIYAHQLLLGVIGAVLKKTNPQIVFIADFHTCAFFELINEPNKGIKYQIKRIVIPIYEKFVIKTADLVITVSNETKKELIKFYKIPESKIQIVKNATNIESVFKIEKDFMLDDLEKYNLNINEHFLCVFPNPRDGFISNDLATDFLISIAKKIQDLDANIKFIVLGGGEIPKKYPSNIIFTGYVKEYNKWLNIANICIATYPENAVCGGVRNKICDYLAVGKPIIATKESMRGFDDLKENINFFMCNDISSFVNKLLEIKNKDLKAMSELNIQKSKEYSWKNRANELKNVLINA